MTAIIEARGLAKYFGRFSALRGLDLTVRPGEFIALFGKNGAGKTTFLRIVAGLSHPSSGSVTIRPEGNAAPRYVRGCIGYLSHNTSLYMDLTALENLRFYAKLMDLPAHDGFLLEQIRIVGLAGREKDPVRNYSRGMQQRLAIARGFMHDPAILLLDEPFTGLDQAGSDFLKAYLAGAHSRGKTCIMTVHDPQLGYELADRLVVIDRGVAALDLAGKAVTLEEFQQRYSLIVNRP